jgi:hypothetical protein
MDEKEKNVVEQIVDKVNDLVESIANTASDALDQATEPATANPKRQSVPAYEFPAPAPNRASAQMKKTGASAQPENPTKKDKKTRISKKGKSSG